MTREEERLVIDQVLAGRVNFFERLVTENQHKTYNLALRMVGNEDDALDLAQDAFLKAFNSLSSFNREGKFSTWLYRITMNTCLDFLRRQKRKGTISLTVDNEENGEQEELDIPDGRYTPETELERRELRLALNNALLELSEDMRQIIILREINGLSYDEIAEVLDLTEGTVKSRLFRARKKLCKALMKNGNIFDGFTSNL